MTGAGRSKIPVSAAIVSLIALAVPVAASLFFNDVLGEYEALLWLLALVPAFLLAYHRGWRGAALALVGGMLLLVAIQIVLSQRGSRVEHGELFVGVVGAYIGMVLGVGWVAGMLLRQRALTAELGTTLGLLKEEQAERDAAQQALAESEATLRTIMETSPDIVAIVVSDGSITYMSPAVREALGYEPEALIGRSPQQLAHPEDREKVARLPALARLSGTAVKSRFRFRRADGHWVWLDMRARRMTGATGQLQDAVLMVVNEVTAQVQLERALRNAKQEAVRAKEEAERANQAKSTFLSRMSHELRTPMNAVLGFAQLMRRSKLEPDDVESVDQILRAGRHLLELINEVLDLARIEAGRLKISVEPVHARNVFDEAVELIRPLAAQRQIELRANGVLLDEQHVRGDRQRLKQVLLNLLSNAIKYNSEAGQVHYGCDLVADDRLRFRVRDTGGGISREKMAELFSPFSRLGADKTGIEGTGLGLALSKGLVEAMGGVIGVDSEVGKGSTFWVELPLEASPLVAPAPAEPAAPAAAVRAPVAARAQEDARIVLYIEDNLSNYRLVERILAGRRDIELFAAMQGGLGLELAFEHQPDVVLLDLHLPDIDGEEVLRRLLNDPRTRSIPVIMVSADATPAQIDKMIQMGARAYLTKPIDVDQFLTTLDGALKEKVG